MTTAKKPLKNKRALNNKQTFLRIGPKVCSKIKKFANFFFFFSLFHCLLINWMDT